MTLLHIKPSMANALIDGMVGRDYQETFFQSHIFPLPYLWQRPAVASNPARLSPFTIPVESDLNFDFNKSCIIHVIPSEF